MKNFTETFPPPLPFFEVFLKSLEWLVYMTLTFPVIEEFLFFIKFV